MPNFINHMAVRVCTYRDDTIGDLEFTEALDIGGDIMSPLSTDD